ncbi:MAG: hypothetical protein HY290_08670 [Planctomycetia bacterium]|nr:hypothetical protein [Planctomycetia bacterium]
MMTFLLPTLAVAFAAFCIWLTVRIINRRERWAKWTLVAVIGVPVLYVASFGPACWWFATELPVSKLMDCPEIYLPVGRVYRAAGGRDSWIGQAINWYATRRHAHVCVLYGPRFELVLFQRQD